MYNLIIRPLLFCIDPEKVHRMLLSWLKFYRYLFPVRACVRGYSRVSDPFSYGHLQFKNRIGLSAGFAAYSLRALKLRQLLKLNWKAFLQNFLSVMKNRLMKYKGQHRPLLMPPGQGII